MLLIEGITYANENHSISGTLVDFLARKAGKSYEYIEMLSCDNKKKPVAIVFSFTKSKWKLVLEMCLVLVRNSRVPMLALKGKSY